MAENISSNFFNAVIKASLSKPKSGFESNGVWMDWNLNDGVLKGHFSIPIERVADSSKQGCIIIAQDFLSYLGD